MESKLYRNTKIVFKKPITNHVNPNGRLPKWLHLPEWHNLQTEIVSRPTISFGHWVSTIRELYSQSMLSISLSSFGSFFKQSQAQTNKDKSRILFRILKWLPKSNQMYRNLVVALYWGIQYRNRRSSVFLVKVSRDIKQTYDYTGFTLY